MSDYLEQLLSGTAEILLRESAPITRAAQPKQTRREASEAEEAEAAEWSETLPETREERTDEAAGIPWRALLTGGSALWEQPLPVRERPADSTAQRGAAGAEIPLLRGMETGDLAVAGEGLPGSGLYRRLAAAVAERVAPQRPVEVRSVGEEKAVDTQAWMREFDCAVQRDSRRYDGAMNLY